MEGYILKNYNNIKLLIRESLVPACSDEQWKDMCLKLFSDKNRRDILKEGAYKTIFKTTINETPCIVKKYRNNGFIRKIKSPFFPSKAMNEFHAAVSISRKGIPTACPLLMAETKKGWFVRESLVVIPFLSEAQELRDIFFDLAGFPVSKKKGLLEDFGRLTGKIFNQGIFQNDYSLNNFMVREEDKKLHIYFIDFERVKIKKDIFDEERLFLLAKLNRIGREISIADRMRFLRGYLSIDHRLAENVKALALKLQIKTAAVLKKDLKRCRLTSIYTHGNYERIKLAGYKGLYKKGYDPEEIIRQIENIPDSPSPVNISLRFAKSETVLKAVQFKDHDAEKAWSIISTLIIAGLPMELPHVLVQNDSRGFIITKLQTLEKLMNLLSSKTHLPDFIRTNFTEELKKLRCVLAE